MTHDVKGVGCRQFNSTNKNTWVKEIGSEVILGCVSKRFWAVFLVAGSTLAVLQSRTAADHPTHNRSVVSQPSSTILSEAVQVFQT